MEQKSVQIHGKTCFGGSWARFSKMKKSRCLFIKKWVKMKKTRCLGISKGAKMGQNYEDSPSLVSK